MVKIKIYFGNDLGNSFEKKLCSDLNWVGILLRRYYFQIDSPPDLNKIEQSIDITNKNIYEMNEKMLKTINDLEGELF